MSVTMSVTDLSKERSHPCLRHAHKSGGGHTTERLVCPAKTAKTGQNKAHLLCHSHVRAFSVRTSVLTRKVVAVMTTLLRIKDVQNLLAAGRSTVYELIDRGELERVYIGSSPRIVDTSVESYINRLRQPLFIDTHEGMGR